MPLSRISPSVGSYRRHSNLMNVVFPLPFMPTTARRSPTRNFIDICRKAYSSVSYTHLYYTVCRQKDGGYVYLFFDRPRSMQDYGVYSSQDKTNIFLHGVLYAEKKLAYEDFASIEIGDNIENVIAIDPAAALCKTLYNWNTALYGEEHYFDYRAVSSLHLLTDGILEVRYLIQDEGELTVDKLFYYPDYQYMSSGYHRITGNKVYMNLTVFPQDFPSA